MGAAVDLSYSQSTLHNASGTGLTTSWRNRALADANEPHLCSARERDAQLRQTMERLARAKDAGGDAAKIARLAQAAEKLSKGLEQDRALQIRTQQQQLAAEIERRRERARSDQLQAQVMGRLEAQFAQLGRELGQLNKRQKADFRQSRSFGAAGALADRYGYGDVFKAITTERTRMVKELGTSSRMMVLARVAADHRGFGGVFDAVFKKAEASAEAAADGAVKVARRVARAADEVRDAVGHGDGLGAGTFKATVVDFDGSVRVFTQAVRAMGRPSGQERYTAAVRDRQGRHADRNGRLRDAAHLRMIEGGRGAGGTSDRKPGSMSSVVAQAATNALTDVLGGVAANALGYGAAAAGCAGALGAAKGATRGVARAGNALAHGGGRWGRLLRYGAGAAAAGSGIAGGAAALGGNVVPFTPSRPSNPGGGSVPDANKAGAVAREVTGDAASVVKGVKGPRVRIASSAAQVAGKALKTVLGPAALALEVLDGWNQLQDLYGMYKTGEITEDEYKGEFGAVVGSMLGGAAGAAALAKLGAVAGGLTAGPIGAAAGAVAGGVAGGLAGSAYGADVGRWVAGKTLGGAGSAADSGVPGGAGGVPGGATTPSSPGPGAPGRAGGVEYGSGSMPKEQSPEAYFGKDVDVSKLPAGMRNNNPGNLKYTNSKWQQKNFPGMVGPSKNLDEGSPQIVFNSPEAGLRAMARLALGKFDAGAKTIQGLIAGPGGWTPGHRTAPGNIAKTMGINANEQMNLREPKQMSKFMRALMWQEHGPSNQLYKDDAIQAAAETILGLRKEQAVTTPSELVRGGGPGGNVDEKQGRGIRRQPITPELRATLERAGADLGVHTEVYSGGQDATGANRTGSHRHDGGRSADVRLYTTGQDGKKRYLSMDKDADRALMEGYIRGTVRHGATGVGAGPGYMGAHGIHIGGGPVGAWGAGGSSANAPAWVRRALADGLADRKNPSRFQRDPKLGDGRKDGGVTEASPEAQKADREEAWRSQANPFNRRVPGSGPAAAAARAAQALATAGSLLSRALGPSEAKAGELNLPYRPGQGPGSIQNLPYRPGSMTPGVDAVLARPNAMDGSSVNGRRIAAEMDAARAQKAANDDMVFGNATGRPEGFSRSWQGLPADPFSGGGSNPLSRFGSPTSMGWNGVLGFGVDPRGGLGMRTGGPVSSDAYASRYGGPMRRFRMADGEMGYTGPQGDLLPRFSRGEFGMGPALTKRLWDENASPSAANFNSRYNVPAFGQTPSFKKMNELESWPQSWGSLAPGSGMGPNGFTLQGPSAQSGAVRQEVAQAQAKAAEKDAPPPPPPPPPPAPAKSDGHHKDPKKKLKKDEYSALLGVMNAAMFNKGVV